MFTQPFIQEQIKKTSRLRVPGLYTGNLPVTDEFPEQRASNAENVSIWWRHHDDIDGLVQDFSISIANAMEILQSCIKPSI